MSEFWIYQVSEYIRFLNINRFLLGTYFNICRRIKVINQKNMSKGVSSDGRGGCNTPSPIFFKFVSILTKCVGKIYWPNVVGKFGVFYHKKRNAGLYQYLVPQKSNFYRRWQLLNKLYTICTDDKVNDEYLAVEYILDFLLTISYDICNVMFINEQERLHENEAIIPT